MGVLQQRKIHHLRNVNTQLRDALQDLYDEQNGPPLLANEESWDEAMEKARAALELDAPAPAGG